MCLYLSASWKERDTRFRVIIKKLMKVGGVTETNKEKRGTQESYHLQA